MAYLYIKRRGWETWTFSSPLSFPKKQFFVVICGSEVYTISESCHNVPWETIVFIMDYANDRLLFFACGLEDTT